LTLHFLVELLETFLRCCHAKLAQALIREEEFLGFGVEAQFDELLNVCIAYGSIFFCFGQLTGDKTPELGRTAFDENAQATSHG